MNKMMIPRNVTDSDDDCSSSDVELSLGSEIDAYPEITNQDPALAHDYVAALRIIIHQEEYLIKNNDKSSQLLATTYLERVTSIGEPTVPSESVLRAKSSGTSSIRGRMQALATKLNRQLAAYRGTSEHVREQTEQVMDALAMFRSGSEELRSSINELTGDTHSPEKDIDE